MNNLSSRPWHKHPVIEIILLVLLAFLFRTFLYGLYQVPTGSMETTLLVGERFLSDKLSMWIRNPQRGEIIAFNEPNYNYSSNPLKALFEHYVWGPQNWTKRIIGIPGDRVRGAIENGKTVIYLNEKKLDEPYLNQYPLIKQWINKGIDFNTRAPYTLLSYDPATPFDQQPFYRINPTLIDRAPNGTPVLIHPGTPQSYDVFDVTLGKNEYWAMGDNREGSYDSRRWGKLHRKFIHGRIIFRIWSIDSNDDWWIFDLLRHPIDFWQRIRWSRCLEKVH